MTLGLTRYKDEQLHIGICRVEGKFQFDTATDPSNIIGRGIESVAHTTTGVWTVTFNSEFGGIVGVVACFVSLELDAAADTHLQTGAFTEATPTVVVRAHTGGSLADIAAGSNDGNWCHISAVLKYSTAEDGSGLV